MAKQTTTELDDFLNDTEETLASDVETEEEEIEEIELDDEEELASPVAKLFVSDDRMVAGQVSRKKRGAEKEPEYILQERKVDRYTTIRRRVLLTPSKCTVNGCSFDVAERNGYPGGWEEVPQDQRPQMLLALKKHIEYVHTASQAHIVGQSELPTRWLGGKKI